MAKAKKISNVVKVKFISLEEAMKLDTFDGIDRGLELRLEDNNNYILFPSKCLGTEQVLLKEDNRYTIQSNDYSFTECELGLFSSLISKVISGIPLATPIEIEGDFLTFNEDNQCFECGCKTIDKELADKIFRTIGARLGYEISG